MPHYIWCVAKFSAKWKGSLGNCRVKQEGQDTHWGQTVEGLFLGRAEFDLKPVVCRGSEAMAYVRCLGK